MNETYDDVLKQLEPLRPVPNRSAEAARSGLQVFLNEAARLHPTVSAADRARPTGWKHILQPARPIMSMMVKIALMLMLVVGGAGITVAAAQESLPNEVLYPVKILIENVQWGTAQGPEAQIDLMLDQAQQRVHEMVQLTDRGAAIPADVPTRLQTQLQTALQVATQLDDQAMPAALDRIRLRVQDQLRAAEQLHLNEAAQVLAQVRDMAQLGQSDPHTFRARFGQGRPTDAPPQPQRTPATEPTTTPQPSRTPQSSRTPLPSRTPQPAHTPQWQHTGTPQGNSYGAGPQVTAQPATPVGQGDGHEYGPGPESTPQGPDGSPATPASGGDGSGSGGSGSGSGGSGSGDTGSGGSSGGDSGGGGGTGRP